jgi:chorismate mutase
VSPVKLVALRGAVTCDADTSEEIATKTQRVLSELIERNEIGHEDLVSVIFTATDDLQADFPASSARAMGLGDVPLLCARELGVEGGMARCVRLLVHCYSDRSRDQLHHVYLEGARALRDDLPD